jgi:hypothetical protein
LQEKIKMMNTLVIKAEEDKIAQITAFLNTLQVSFTVKKKAEKPYNPEFVKMVLERSASAKKGNVTQINPNDLWGSLGLK